MQTAALKVLRRGERVSGSFFINRWGRRLCDFREIGLFVSLARKKWLENKAFSGLWGLVSHA